MKKRVLALLVVVAALLAAGLLVLRWLPLSPALEGAAHAPALRAGPAGGEGAPAAEPAAQDLPDLPALRYVGLGVAVANACVDVRQAADYVTTALGGSGAVREVIEVVLRSQQRWDDVVHSYQ